MKACIFWKAALSALTLLTLFQRESATVPDSSSEPSVSLGTFHKKRRLTDTVPTEVTTCGGVARRRTGILQTPGFPSPFPVPFRCNWIVDASAFPGASIVVYLTQVFITKGLRFESFAFLDIKGALSTGRTDSKSSDSSFPSFDRRLVFDSDFRALKEVSWIRFNSPYLLATLALDRLEGSHIRDLGQLLRVYGLNMTFEVIAKSQSVRKRRCSLLECSMAGHCFAKKDFRSFYCSCFNGYFGSHCEYSRFCDPSKNATLCLNGGTCRHMGSTAFHCLCKEGFSGALCQYKDIKRTSSNLSQVLNCRKNDYTGICPFDGELASNCPLQINATTKSRYTVTIKLKNMSLLQNNSSSLLKTVFQEQVFIKHLSTPDMNEIKINSVSENGEVSFEVIADKKKFKELKDALSNSNTSLGDLTFHSEHPTYQFENQLLLKDVVVDEKEVPLGGEFIASCVAQGSPAMEFTWFKDGVQVDHTLAVRHMWQKLIEMDSKGSYTALLRITGAAVEDDGELSCHVKDAGIHQWKATRVKVVKHNPVTVKPKTISLVKGENGSVTCISSIEQGMNPDALEFFWMKNNTHIVKLDNYEIAENLYPYGSILHIYNASASAIYTCHVIKKIGSSISHQHSFAASVYVGEPASTSFCPPVYAWGVHWPRTATGQQAVTECPFHPPASDSHITQNKAVTKLRDPLGENTQWKEWNGHEGEAKHSCKEVEGKAIWDEEPDFSGCQWGPLMAIQNKFRKLTLGYKATSILESFRQLLSFLTSSIPTYGEDKQRHDRFDQTEPPSLYPGQGETVVSFLADVQEYLQLKVEIKRNASEWRSISMNMIKIVDNLLSRESTVKNVKRILQLLCLPTRQLLLWNDKLTDHHIVSFHYPEIEVSHEREILKTKTDETYEDLVYQNSYLHDDASIVVYSEPVSWNHKNYTNLVTNLHYPRDELRHPKWFKDQVSCQFSLTTKKKLEKYNKDIRREDQSDSYEVDVETANVDTQSFGHNASLPPALPSIGINASSVWTLVAFQNHGSILSLNYTANTRYGYDLEHRIISNIIFVDVTGKDHLDNKSRISKPSGEMSFQQSMNSSFDFNIEFFLNIHSLLDLTSLKKNKSGTWNVTCAKISFNAKPYDSEVSTLTFVRNHWQLDFCKPIPSSAVKDWIIGKTSNIKENVSQEVKDKFSVMCHCNKAGAYAVLILLKKMKVPDSSHGNSHTGSEEKWILTLDYFGILLQTYWITTFGCGFCFFLTFASLILLLYQFHSPSLLCINNEKKKHQVHHSSSPKHFHFLPYMKKCFPYSSKFWIHLFKMQFCIAVILTMALLISALQSSPDKLSHSCIKTSLVVILMVAMSSLLGKVLIIFAEVMTAACIVSLSSVTSGVNLVENGNTEINGIDSRKMSIDIQRLKSKANSFLQRINPSIWGVVTGIPIVMALVANISQETTTLESWWLIRGSLLFNAFITSSAVTFFAFASMLTYLLRYLSSLHSLTKTAQSIEDGVFEINDQILHKLPQYGSRLIQERITLLKKSASIFTSLVSMVLWSILSVNTSDVLFTWYIFSLSCILLGLVIFFCYVIKSDASPCICRILKSIKEKFCCKNAETETRCSHKDNEGKDSFNMLISLFIEMQLDSRSKEERMLKSDSRESKKRENMSEQISTFHIMWETIRKRVILWFRNKQRLTAAGPA